MVIPSAMPGRPDHEEVRAVTDSLRQIGDDRLRSEAGDGQADPAERHHRRRPRPEPTPVDEEVPALSISRVDPTLGVVVVGACAQRQRREKARQ
jgi:hypothetical protein